VEICNITSDIQFFLLIDIDLIILFPILDPLVFKKLLNWGALFVIFSQAYPNKIFCLITDLIPNFTLKFSLLVDKHFF